LSTSGNCRAQKNVLRALYLGTSTMVPRYTSSTKVLEYVRVHVYCARTIRVLEYHGTRVPRHRCSQYSEYLPRYLGTINSTLYMYVLVPRYVLGVLEYLVGTQYHVTQTSVHIPVNKCRTKITGNLHLSSCPATIRMKKLGDQRAARELWQCRQRAAQPCAQHARMTALRCM
jgi:hypothetical protein